MRPLVARLVRRLRRLAPRGVVLCYHRVGGPRADLAQLDVSAAHFAEHLAVLRSHAHPMPLDAFERARRVGALPERAVAVTFDDGYADNLHTALPLLEAHAVPAEVFVVTGAPARGGEFWWDQIALAISQPERPAALRLAAEGLLFEWPPAPSAGDAPSDAARDDAAMYRALSRWMRPLAAPTKDALAAQVRTWAGVTAEPRDSHRPLRVDELVQLASSPLIGIGSHTVTHPVLAALSAGERAAECRESRAALQRWLGAAPAHFAYPFGDGAALNREAMHAARDAGYAVSLTTAAQAAWRGNRAHAVPRVAMHDWDGAEFRRRLDLWFNE